MSVRRANWRACKRENKQGDRSKCGIRKWGLTRIGESKLWSPTEKYRRRNRQTVGHSGRISKCHSPTVGKLLSSEKIFADSRQNDLRCEGCISLMAWHRYSIQYMLFINKMPQTNRLLAVQFSIPKEREWLARTHGKSTHATRKRRWPKRASRVSTSKTPFLLELL